jgi:hypothetical protein
MSDVRCERRRADGGCQMWDFRCGIENPCDQSFPGAPYMLKALVETHHVRLHGIGCGIATYREDVGCQMWDFRCGIENPGDQSFQGVPCMLKALVETHHVRLHGIGCGMSGSRWNE